MFRKILAPLKDAPNTPSQQSPQKGRWRDVRGKENLTSSSPVHISEPSDFRLIAHVECDPNTGHYKGIDEFMTLATLPRGRRSPIKSRTPPQGLPLPPTRSVASLQALLSAASPCTSPPPFRSHSLLDDPASSNDNSRSLADLRALRDSPVTLGGSASAGASPSGARPPRAPVKPVRSSPVTPPPRRPTAGRMNVSRPFRTKHVVHVRLDPSNPTGFSGLPLAWENILMLSGILRHEAMANPEAVIDVLNFSKAAHPATSQLDGAPPSPRVLPPIQLDNLPSVTSFDDVSDGPSLSLGPTNSSSSRTTSRNSDAADDAISNVIRSARGVLAADAPTSPTTPPKKSVETCVVNEMNSDYMESFIGAERKINLPDGIPDYVDASFRQDDPNALFSRMELIGEGSCGNVYRAIDREGKFVALKKVHPENERDWKLYKFEVHVMQDQTDSENLVDCFDAFRCGDELWMVMEYVSAGTLADLLAGRRAAIQASLGDRKAETGDFVEGAMDESMIAFICREVLQGLDSLHTIRRVHRDIKGDNVLLDMDGSVKVADFGFCAELSKRLGKRNTVVGTPFWMAPEVIRGANYDTKVDIWSAGILALECAQGKPPHVGVSPIRAMFLIATQGAPEIPESAKWSQELRDFIQSCCSVKPGSRPTAQEALMHPFIAKACSKEDAASFFNEACEERIRLRRNA